MAIETMLLDRKLGVEEWMNLAGANPRGDPKSSRDKGTEKNSCPSRARNLSHQFASFFKIGRGYDWEEQYTEYQQFWENYFQGHLPA